MRILTGICFSILLLAQSSSALAQDLELPPLPTLPTPPSMPVEATQNTGLPDFALDDFGESYAPPPPPPAPIPTAQGSSAVAMDSSEPENLEPSGETNSNSLDNLLSDVGQEAIGNMVPGAIVTELGEGSDKNEKEQEMAEEEEEVEENVIDPLERIREKQARIIPPSIFEGDLDKHLFIAASTGNIAGLEALLRMGRNPDSQNAKGNTALMAAALSNQLDIASLVMLHKPDPDVQNNLGMTALHIASYGKREAIVELLLQAGANVNIKNIYGNTPLMAASLSGSENIVRRLIRDGAEIDAQNNEGFTALHVAAHNGWTNIVSLLIERNALPTIPSNYGVTAEELAASAGFSDAAYIISNKIASERKKLAAAVEMQRQNTPEPSPFGFDAYAAPVPTPIEIPAAPIIPDLPVIPQVREIIDVDKPVFKSSQNLDQWVSGHDAGRIEIASIPKPDPDREFFTDPSSWKPPANDDGKWMQNEFGFWYKQGGSRPSINGNWVQNEYGQWWLDTEHRLTMARRRYSQLLGQISESAKLSSPVLEWWQNYDINNLNYDMMSDSEKAQWDELLAQWMEADAMFDQLSYLEKQQWNEKLQYLKKVFRGHFTAGTAREQAELEEYMRRWTELDGQKDISFGSPKPVAESELPALVEDDSEPVATPTPTFKPGVEYTASSASNKHAELMKLLGDWYGLDSRFNSMSKQEKQATLLKRDELLDQILYGKVNGKYADEFAALPEDEQIRFRKTMDKWDAFYENMEEGGSAEVVSPTPSSPTVSDEEAKKLLEELSESNGYHKPEASIDPDDLGNPNIRLEADFGDDTIEANLDANAVERKFDDELESDYNQPHKIEMIADFGNDVATDPPLLSEDEMNSPPPLPQMAW